MHPRRGLPTVARQVRTTLILLCDVNPLLPGLGALPYAEERAGRR